MPQNEAQILVHTLRDTSTAGGQARLIQSHASLFTPENWDEIKAAGLVSIMLQLPMMDARGKMDVSDLLSRFY